MGLKPETTYTVRLAALNGKGLGEISAASEFKTQPVRKYSPLPFPSQHSPLLLGAVGAPSWPSLFRRQLFVFQIPLLEGVPPPRSWPSVMTDTQSLCPLSRGPGHTDIVADQDCHTNVVTGRGGNSAASVGLGICSLTQVTEALRTHGLEDEGKAVTVSV